MDTRKPGTYAPCPYRAGGRPAPPNQMMRPQAAAIQKASAAALSQPKPPAKPAMEPAAKPPEQTTLPAPLPPAQTRPAPPPPPPAPVQLPAKPASAWLSAWAKDFTVTAESGKRAPLPLETQRAHGGMALDGGSIAMPEDGYHMVLWELGVAGAQGGEATLQLGIDGAASQLTYALRPGYDSGQQVTWLGKGDKLGLFVQTEDSKAEVNCSSAQFTVIRLG